MADWDRTEFASKRLEAVIDGEFYKGRKLIHKDTPIDGGVYLGAYLREAIVVDSEKYTEISRIYNIAKEKAGVERNDGRLKERVLNAVFDTVKESMNYDEAAAHRLVDIYKSGTDGKIALDVFIKNKVGVCRHMALACGALLELFKKDGYIRGNASIDRNTDRRGHVWCRYTNSGGDVFILDVARNYIGLLKDAKNWDYRRPDEQ